MITVDSLVDDVRLQIDESNISDITDPKILQALNRARLKLVRLAGRKYASMFKGEDTLTLNGQDLNIPDDAFGFVVNSVAVVKDGVIYEVAGAQDRQVTGYDGTNQNSPIPLYYSQQGRTLKFYPPSNTDVQIRLKYQRRSAPFVLTQARVTGFDIATGVLELDAIGDGLTTSIASLGAFINIVDPMTGFVRATCQVGALDTDDISLTIKSTGLARTVVYGQTVATALPDDLALDDLVCLASGVCVPTLVMDYSDYLTQFAVVELKRKAGESVAEEMVALNALEEDIRAMWAGRGSTMRVERVGGYWGSQLPLIQRYR